MPGLGRVEHVQQSLYAICLVLEEKVRGGRSYRWRGALTSMFAERDKLRAVARKGWVGSGDAFDSLVTTSPCFEFTQRPRVGNESLLALLC